MGSDVEHELRARWTLLGLAETAVALPVDATITPRTLALADWHAGREPGADAGNAPRPAEPHLPRISVDLAPPPPPTPSTPAPAGADLHLLRTLGEGGMGRVHLAHQRSLGRDVAVKALKEGASGAVAEALLHEARLTGSLEHPGVIPVHALGLDDAGHPLLVMKRVEGVEWRALLADANHPLWASRATTDRLTANLEILIQVAQTVQFAHSRGVVHLDVKPENVMVGEYGEVYLVDWGIARKLDAAGDPRALVGTPAYMAPEMALGRALNARSDVYLLGATLHHVLTGCYRHDGKTLESVLLSAALSTPVTYDDAVPEQLADLCNRATSFEPAARPATAQAFRQELLDFLRHRSANALAETAGERLQELERALTAARTDEPPADLADAHRLATEARFGFAQALREHPDHAGARRGAQRTLAALIELELRQEHADTARALLRELAAPDPALIARIEAAEARAERRRHEGERLREMEHDLDPAEAERPRALALGLVAALISSISLYMGLVEGVETVTPVQSFRISIVLMVVLGAVGLGLRRRLLTNAFNRRLAGLLAVAVASSMINRGVGWVVGTPLQDTLAADLAIFFAITAGGAISVLPSMWWSAALLASSWGVVRAVPEHALPIFSASALANIVVIVLVLRRESRRRRAAT